MDSQLEWDDVLGSASTSATIFGTEVGDELEALAPSMALARSCDGDVAIVCRSSVPDAAILDAMRAEVATSTHPTDFRPCRVVVVRA